MYDFIIRLYSYLNIDPSIVGSYDSVMVIMSSFSFLVSIVNIILKKCKISQVDEMIESFFNIFHKNGDKRLKSAEILFIADFCLLAINVAKLFVTIPKDFYAVLMVVTAICVVVTAFFMIAKALVALVFLFIGLGGLLEGDFLFFICALICMVLIVASAVVNGFQSLMNFNEVLTILRAIG